MVPTDIVRKSIWQGRDVVEMARVEIDGECIVQADITSISRKIYDLTGGTPATSIDESTPLKTSVIFNTLQTGGPWSEDGTGYNFKQRIAGAEFPDAGHKYRVEYKFTGAAGELFALVFEHETQTTYV